MKKQPEVKGSKKMWWLQPHVLGIVGALAFGGIWKGKEYIQNARIGWLKGRVVKLENKLVVCYGDKKSETQSDKLLDCLMKARDNGRKIKNCHKKYGGEK